MVTIHQDNDSYVVSDQHGTPLSFFKDDINESKKLLEYIVFALGLNTDSCKIDIKTSQE